MFTLSERRQEIDVQSLSEAMRGPERSHFDGLVPRPRPNFGDAHFRELIGAASDTEGSTMGYDDTGIRPRGRDLNSGPEKGNFSRFICA